MICSTKKLMIDAKVSKFMNTQISQSLCQLDSNIIKKGPQTTKNRLSVKKNLFNLDNTNKQTTVDDFYFQQIDEKQKTVKIVTENSILKEKKENLLSLMNSGRGNKCLNESAMTIMKQKQQINELLKKKKQLQALIQASNLERKQQKEEYQEKHSKQMAENEQLIENNKQLKKYIEAITNQNNTLKSEKQKAFCQKEQCQIKLQTLSKQHNLTIIKLDEVTRKLENLHRPSDLLPKQFQQQLSPNKTLSTKFKLIQITQEEQRQASSNENSLSKIEQDEQILERIQQKIKRLQIDLEYFIQTCNKLRKQNTKLKLQIQTQRQKAIQQKQDQILILQNKLQQEHAKLINQNRQLELSNESLTLEIRSLSQKLAHSSASSSLITSQLHSYKQEYQTLKKRQFILQTEFKKYQGLIEAHIQLKQNYSQLQTNYLALYHSYKSLYDEYMDKSSQKDFIHQLNSSHSLLFQQSLQQDSNSNNSHRLYQIHSLPIRANANNILDSHQPSLSSESNSSSSALTINNPPKIILQDLIKETLSTL